MVTRRSGRREPGAVVLIEGGAGLGAAVGLLIAVSHAARHVAPRPCHAGHPAAALGNCLGESLNHTLMPYVTSALVGGLVGVAIVLSALLLWRLASRPVALAFAGARPPSTMSTRPRREPIHQRVRHEVWRRDEGCCVDCGSRDRLEFDHIIPVSRGGSNTARNIELRCESCNRRKSDRI